MFSPRHFNTRHLRSFHFNGGPPSTISEKNHFSPKFLGAKSFTGLQHFARRASAVRPIAVVPSSIAIQVTPNTVNRNDTVTVKAYVYDQFGKPMKGVRVVFTSTNPTVLSVPAPGDTNDEGYVEKSVLTYTTGTTSLYAAVDGLFAFTSVVVESAQGGVSSSLTHGATIQIGSSGGGMGGNIAWRHSTGRRWPTR